MKSADIYQIHAYDLVSFVEQFQHAVQEGYVIDLKTIDNYPQMIGTQFVMNLVKPNDSKTEKEVKDEVVVEKQQTQEAQEDKSKEPAKRGPKAK